MLTNFEKVDAFISRPSLSLNIFILNFIRELLNMGLDCGVDVQSLNIGSKARDAHNSQVVDFEYSLEVAVNGHEFG